MNTVAPGGGNRLFFKEMHFMGMFRQCEIYMFALSEHVDVARVKRHLERIKIK